MAAVSLQHSKSALGAEFRRVARRKGYSVAVFAIARKLAQLVYRALRYGQEYLDIGEEAYEKKRHQHRALASVVARAADLGYDLVAQESETAAAAA